VFATHFRSSPARKNPPMERGEFLVGASVYGRLVPVRVLALTFSRAELSPLRCRSRPKSPRRLGQRLESGPCFPPVAHLAGMMPVKRAALEPDFRTATHYLWRDGAGVRFTTETLLTQAPGPRDVELREDELLPVQVIVLISAKQDPGSALDLLKDHWDPESGCSADLHCFRVNNRPSLANPERWAGSFLSAHGTDRHRLLSRCGVGNAPPRNPEQLAALARL
jgi:hypothetical protein